MAPHVVVGSAEIAHENQHVRVGDAQLEEDLGGVFVVAFLVKTHRLFGVGLGLLVHLGRFGRQRHRHGGHADQSNQSKQTDPQ